MNMNILKLISFILVFIKTGLFIKVVESYNKDLNLFVLLRYLDVNSLSRLIAFKNYIDDKTYDLRPKFGNGWHYHTKLIDRWTRRYGMYGYGISALASYGDNNCMFYTIHTIFHLNNMTNKRLLEDLNPNLEPAVQIAIKGLLNEDEPIKPLNIKRITQIVWLGTDPYDEESVSHFKLEPLLERMYILKSYQENFPGGKIGEEAGTMFKDMDIISYYNRLQNEPNKIDILKEIWDEFESKLHKRFGDHKDKETLEYVFQMYMILMNKKSTALTCGINNYNHNPKYIMLMIYEDGCHYDVGGLFKLGTTDYTKIKTLYKIEEIPIPLLLFIAEDCRLRPN